MAIADLLTEVGSAGSVTTLSAPGKAIGTFNINVGSTANWPAVGKTVYFAMRTINPSTISSSNPSGLVAGTYSEWKGIVGTNAITSMVLQSGSTDQVYTAGSNTQVFIPVNAPRENAIVAWGQVHADNQGNLLTAAVQTALGLGTGALNGWNPLVGTPNTVTYNGNRSYTCVFNSTDLTSTLSPGMRLRTTRTVAAPTQSTSLNGTTQYWSKTSPAGMTFTDKFVVSVKFKLTSYNSFTYVESRYNGTSGWYMYLNQGQVYLVGANGGSVNISQVNSYQSVPLNKWVTVTAQLDMATFAITGNGGTTGSYIMIDDVNVPATVSRGGTNPTALAQAGNLEIGSGNGGTAPFPGKIAQVAIFSACIPQATMTSYSSQSFAGTETSLISAYSFNGNANDLNTTNANNLTANGSAVATNADSPFGGQAGGTISSTLDYGIIQSVSFSTNTTVVVQVPEGCTIPTSGGVSAVAYSSVKVPYGFPSTRSKWLVQSIWRTQQSQVAAATTIWYNVGLVSLPSLPIGEWNLKYQAAVSFIGGTSGANGSLISLSTQAAADDSSIWHTLIKGVNVTQLSQVVVRDNNISQSVATTWYLIQEANVAAGAMTLYTLSSTDGDTVISAENAYL